MSRAQVRTKVASWIAANPPTNLNQVFTSFPKRINFQQNSTAGQMTRAALVVHIMSEDESRIAVGGASDGWKRIDAAEQALGASRGRDRTTLHSIEALNSAAKS